jgi:large subunit ribosomal protein L11
MDFCKNFNARTAKDEGLIIPVVVTVYAGPVLYLHHQDAAGRRAASSARRTSQGIGRAGIKTKVGTVTAKQVEDIAKLKMPDLNAESLDAVKTVAGTARAWA